MPRFKENEKLAKKDEKQSALLEAAIGEFAVKGYAAANVNEISVKAGCAKGTVYNYFADKKALFAAAIAATAASHCAYVMERVLAADGARARVDEFFRAGFEYVELNSARANLALATLFGPDEEVRALLGRGYGPLFGFLATELVQSGMDTGAFAPCDPTATATLLMTIYLGCASGVDRKTGKVLMDPRLASDFVFRALEAKREG